MKKLLLATFVSSLFLASCDKSDDPAPAPAAEKYMTTTSGSSWNYAYTDNLDATNNENYTVTALNRDSAAGGKSYRVYSNSVGPNEYYNITGSDYFTLQGFSLGATDTTLINLYLKDGAAVGTSWAQSYTLDAGVPVEVTVTNKIQEKGITKTVGATAYTNVIHVITTIAIPTLAAFPGSSITTDIHYYYAPKYGMIQNDAKIDLVAPALTLDEHSDSQTKLSSATLL